MGGPAVEEMVGIGVRGQRDPASVGTAQRRDCSPAVGVEGDGVDRVFTPLGVEGGPARWDGIGPSGAADLVASTRRGEPAVEAVARIGVRGKSYRAVVGAADRRDCSTAVGVEGDGVDRVFKPLGLEGGPARWDGIGRSRTTHLGAAARLGEPADEGVIGIGVRG
jgi:hypothetical protein